ncbi:hypothetical protein SCHPADRAFT_416491 [Schizopora paradoxa]|uniref:Uncharacterized protein n=1 Tax=Schizopora paradoxa TaxID=27342 RepID=A0A0H2RKE6_9AGAM|nr:hypothetical protein SCHPADRAFT_416491 [Schizopora paradoxa]
MSQFNASETKKAAEDIQNNRKIRQIDSTIVHNVALSSHHPAHLTKESCRLHTLPRTKCTNVRPQASACFRPNPSRSEIAQNLEHWVFSHCCMRILKYGTSDAGIVVFAGINSGTFGHFGHLASRSSGGQPFTPKHNCRISSLVYSANSRCTFSIHALALNGISRHLRCRSFIRYRTSQF